MTVFGFRAMCGGVLAAALLAAAGCESWTMSPAETAQADGAAPATGAA